MVLITNGVWNLLLSDVVSGRVERQLLRRQGLPVLRF